jgi:hypothetical protein
MITAEEQPRDGGPLAAEPAPAHASNLPQALFQLATLSQKLFGPSVMIESMHDPDAPQGKWIVFHVTASGDSEVRREQADRWYDEAAKILPESATELRLSILPRP